jgi:hypothetical protein
VESQRYFDRLARELKVVSALDLRKGSNWPRETPAVISARVDELEPNAHAVFGCGA